MYFANPIVTPNKERMARRKEVRKKEDRGRIRSAGGHRHEWDQIYLSITHEALSSVHAVSLLCGTLCGEGR